MSVREQRSHRDVRRGSARFAGRGSSDIVLDTVARIGAICSSGAPAAARAAELLEELRIVLPYRGALLTAVSGTHRDVVRVGYSTRIAERTHTEEFHSELVTRFGLVRGGWPFRERDLPVDPMSIRTVAEFLRPEGYLEGLLSSLVSPDGRYLGFLIASVDNDDGNPDDNACAVVGRIAPLLANLVDPLQSATALAATLVDADTVLAYLPDGTAMTLRGAPPAVLAERSSELLEDARQALRDRRTAVAGFVRPREGDGWYVCSAYACLDGTTVVSVTPQADLFGLTPRELQVLSHVVRGDGNSAIAETLSITTRTVRAHVEHILLKLEVSTRAGAASRAVAEGLLLA
jgi:DNA-binding CsgD family transcriptional regulator